MTKQIEVVEETIEAIANLSKNDAITILITEHGYDFTQAQAIYKEHGAGIRASKSGGFNDVLAFLQAEPRTQSEFYGYVIDNGTKNEARWISQRDSIRKLAIAIYVKGGYDFVESPASDKLKADIKAIVKG